MSLLTKERVNSEAALHDNPSKTVILGLFEDQTQNPNLDSSIRLSSLNLSSLQSVTIVSQIEEIFNIDLHMRDFYAMECIADVIQFAEENSDI